MGLRGRFHAATFLVVWFALSISSLAERSVDDDDGRSLEVTGNVPDEDDLAPRTSPQTLSGSSPLASSVKQHGSQDSLLELKPAKQKYQHLEQALHMAARSNASSEVVPVALIALAVAAGKAAAIGCVAGGAGSQLMPLLRKLGVMEQITLSTFKMAILGRDVDSVGGDMFSANRAPGAQLRIFMEEIECRFDFLARAAGQLCSSTSIDDMVSGDPCPYKAKYKDNDADPFKGNAQRACSFLHDARQAHAADFTTFASNKADYLAQMRAIREGPWEETFEGLTTKMLPLFMVASSTQFAEFVLDRAYSPKRRCEKNVGALKPGAVPHSLDAVTSLLVGALARAFPAEPDKTNCGTPEAPEDCADQASEESSGESVVAAEETSPSGLLEIGSGRAGVFPIINNIVFGAAGVNKLGGGAQFGIKWIVRVTEGVGQGLLAASLTPVAAAVGGVTAGLSCAALAQKITGSKEFMAQTPEYVKKAEETFGTTLGAIKTRLNEHWKQPRDACQRLERRRNFWAHKDGPKKRLAFRPSRLKVNGVPAVESLAYHAAPAGDETRFSATTNLGGTGMSKDSGWWAIKGKQTNADFWGDTCVKLERNGDEQATGIWAHLEDVWVPCDSIMNELSGWTECDMEGVERSTCWR